MVTLVALWAEMAVRTAARIVVAVLSKSLEKSEYKYDITGAYLACSLANPLWASTEELIPGNSVGFRGFNNTSASVASASLYEKKNYISDMRFPRMTPSMHFRCNSSLMSHDDSLLGRREANVP